MDRINKGYIDWLRYRTLLYDPLTGIPTVEAKMDDIRRILRDNGRMLVLYFSFLEKLERFIGRENFDSLFIKAIARIKSSIKNGILCLLGSGSGEVILFVEPDTKNSNRSAESYKEEIEGIITDTLKNSSIVSAIEPVYRIGTSYLIFDPLIKFERQVHNAIIMSISDAIQREESIRKKKVEEMEWIIANNMLVTYYQSIVNLEDYSIIGFEALNRAKDSAYFPNAEYFFAFALETDLLFDLERLCRLNAVRNFEKLDDYRLFINFAPKSIYDPELFSENFLEEIEKKELSPESVVFEITERLSVIDFPSFKEAIDRLRGMGFGIAIDDMGTGFSTLQSVAEIGPDFLKYDMALVRNIHKDHIKQAILETLVPFAEKINATIIAEGIENPEDLRTLKSMGVRYGQGFLLSHPKPPPLSLEINRV